MATPIWPIEGVALDSTGEEVAGSLGVVAKAIQTVTALLPDAGALTVPAADAVTNTDWGDVIGNKEDVANETADVASLMAVLRKTLEDLQEHDRHFHNVERWWGATGAPDETNAIDANVDTPFVAVSGNNTWGVAIPIKGSADVPVPAGNILFDARQLLVVDTAHASTYRLRIIYGTGTSGAAIAAGQWTEEMFFGSVGVPENTPTDHIIVRLLIATKLWVQVWNATNGSQIDFFWGTHGYA